MANSPSINNVQRGLRVQRELDAKVWYKYRLHKNMTLKDAYILALTYATCDVELPPEILERIARDKREAAKKKGVK